MPAAKEQFIATGRRKTSVARVILKPGKGTFTVNGLPVEKFFPAQKQAVVRSPLETVTALNKYDVFVNVQGGGVTGQAEATRHGISRALLKIDTEMRKPLKVAGFLTRDPRMVERKKYGRKKARRRFQFSKR
ncbi:MAG TPA: 30S ribosomal protein S9 [bacterium]|nr:30S ribosomal protein S9 [bacterium]